MDWPMSMSKIMLSEVWWSSDMVKGRQSRVGEDIEESKRPWL